MKQRKLTPVQARALIRKVKGFYDVAYEATQAVAMAIVDGKTYRLIYTPDLNFTGIAYKVNK